MKILMLNYEFPPLGGGGGVVGIYPNELCFEKIREKIKNRPYELVRVEF